MSRSISDLKTYFILVNDGDVLEHHFRVFSENGDLIGDTVAGVTNSSYMDTYNIDEFENYICNKSTWLSMIINYANVYGRVLRVDLLNAVTIEDKDNIIASLKKLVHLSDKELRECIDKFLLEN